MHSITHPGPPGCFVCTGAKGKLEAGLTDTKVILPLAAVNHKKNSKRPIIGPPDPVWET